MFIYPKMKNLIFVLLSLLLLASCSKSKKETTEVKFYARGNCDMCKERIEAAALDVKGVSKAVWDVDSKALTVNIDTVQTTLLAVHKAVASVGHSTKLVPMNQKAHDELPYCCKE